MKSLTALLLATLLLFTGCATTPVATAKRIQSAAKVAAYVGTWEFIHQKPEARAAFQTAHDELVFLESQETIDLVTLLAIVHRLPVKELKSPQAQLIIGASMLLLSDYAGSLPVGDMATLKPLVSAIREGIALGLAAAPTTASGVKLPAKTQL